MKRRRREGGSGPVQTGEPGIAEAYGPEVTVVGRGARVEGTLVSGESIRIDGRAKGTISARATVILSSDSHVEADIQAENVVMGGTLRGDVTARTKTELAEGGRVEGSIRSKFLVVNEGARFSGQANTDLGDAPRDTFPEDELQTAYDQAARRAADRYKSILSGLAELDREPVPARDAFPARSGR